MARFRAPGKIILPGAQKRAIHHAPLHSALVLRVHVSSFHKQNPLFPQLYSAEIRRKTSNRLSYHSCDDEERDFETPV